MPLSQEVSDTIKPGDDFYGYVNHRWLEAHPIPADKARIGVFEQLTDENVERLRMLLEAPSAKHEASNITLLKHYYQVSMNEAAIAAASDELVTTTLKEVAALASPTEMMRYIARSHGRGLGLLWDASIEPDDKDSRRYVLRFSQDGLGLPDRDYYLDDADRFVEVRTKYVAFLTDLFDLLKLEGADERAQRVLALETKLATASMTATERRDADSTYHAFTPAALASTFDGVTWNDYFRELGLSSERETIVSQPVFLITAIRALATTLRTTWHDYLILHTLLPLLSKLAEPFEQLHFNFYGRVLRGATEQEPRYRRMIKGLMMVLPEPTGQLFVETHFNETAKVAIYDLVGHLQAAFRARLERLDWMSQPTRAKALAKLETFLPLLGYPDEWRSYDALKLSHSYVGNYLAVSEHEWRRTVSRIDAPVDRQEWLMSPVLVNAYYWPNTNGITFPAGILQPPFFDVSGDFASNYGSIGAVIGHEMTHGFDDEGSKFDPDGNLKSWWSEADRAAFDARSKRLVEQYNRYEVHGNHVNGELTLGENIADLGGVQMAFDALQAKLAESERHESIDGFTPEQRFFMGYARSWRENIRPELSLQYLVMDPHSPDRYRTNGIVRNIDGFYDTFKLSPVDKLYLAPDERVRIW